MAPFIAKHAADAPILATGTALAEPSACASGLSASTLFRAAVAQLHNKTQYWASHAELWPSCEGGITARTRPLRCVSSSLVASLLQTSQICCP